MLFTQTLFLLYLPLVLLGNLATLRWRRVNAAFLLAASWVFLVTWDPQDLALLVAVLFVQHGLLRRIEAAADPTRRRGWWWAAAGLGLGTLAWFKYAGFLAEVLLGRPAAAGAAEVIPLGLSFYTFQCLGLAADVHDGEAPAPDLLTYATFISFFPQIVAGPIVRGSELIPQLETPGPRRRFDWLGGLDWFVLGFAFKVVVADNLGAVVDPYWEFRAHRALGWAGHWALAVAYAGQIFADFAGYSFMAVGLGKWLGFELPENFDAPYLATSFRDFWRRWHITLSAFLRDYLYVRALGGNRGGRARTLRNLLVTMLLGGLWHGAAWTFLAWGAAHGLALAYERARAAPPADGPGARFGRWLAVQAFVVLAWVPFRAGSLDEAAEVLRAMLVPTGGDVLTVPPRLLFGLVWLAPLVVHHLACLHPPTRSWLRAPVPQGALTGALLYLTLLSPSRARGFLYFVF